jgi:hypothetical protein
MVEQFFKDVTDIEGVEAVILFSNQNSIISSWATARYNPTIYAEMGESYLHIFGMLEYMKYDLNEIVVPFDKGLVYARTHSKFYVVVLARLSADVSLIRLAMNVCLKEFEDNRKAKKIIKKLSDKKFYQIKSITLDEKEKIMLEKMLEEGDGAQ